jgi:chromosome segregation ATPase
LSSVERAEKLNAECDELEENLDKAQKAKMKLSIKIRELEHVAKPVPDSRVKELEESNKHLRMEARVLYKDKSKLLKQLEEYQAASAGAPARPADGMSAAEARSLQEQNEKLREELQERNKQWRLLKEENETLKRGQVKPSYNLRKRGGDE